MLRTALIGFPSSGKTTLFQLMTSQRGGAASRATASSRPPWASPACPTSGWTGCRRCTSRASTPRRRWSSPTSRRPAAPARRRCSTSRPYRNADALVHVVRAFRDPSVTHHADEIQPAADAQAMEDELLLADLAVTEKRLERIERDLKKSRTAELERERDLLLRCQDGARGGPPAARRRDERRRAEDCCAASSSSRPSRCCSSSTWTRPTRRCSPTARAPPRAPA